VVVAEGGEAGKVDGEVAGLAAEAGVAADDAQFRSVGQQDCRQGAGADDDFGLPLGAEPARPPAGRRHVKVLAGRCH
jgi:hypothetical protein